jgi:thiol-disulfide isomerase/thioredoxin
VRSRISVGLVIVCLGMAGCGLFDKNGGKSSAPKPFTGLPANQDPAPGPGSDATALDNTLPPRVDGVLAGQVVNKGSNNRVKNAHIQVVDLQNPRGNEAALAAETDDHGYFFIRGLQKGKNYQLIARARDDGRILAGAELAMPPNPKVTIMVIEDLNSPTPDPLLNQPLLPGQEPVNRNSRPGGPAAFLDPPIGSRTDSGGAGTLPEPTQPHPAQPQVAPDRIVQGDSQDGFPKSPTKNPVPVNIPTTPEPVIPPPPGGWTPNAPPVTTTPTSQTNDGTSGAGNLDASDPSPLPPWCQLHGRQLKNLSLYGLDGQAWELRRHRRGTVVLLDFWSTTCPPCVRAIPHLCDLQGTYGQHGLEVIGIAYETGAFPEQAQKVKNIRGRLVMNYTTLLGGGGRGECPVKTQFQVSYLPTLVLLNKDSEVVWRSGPEGLTAEKLRELRYEIARQLRVSVPARW